MRCQIYRLILKWIASLNSRLSCRVDRCGVWLNFEWLSRQWNQISLIYVGRQQKLFFQLHTVVKLVFHDITIFKTTHGYQAYVSTNLWNKLREKIFIEICERGWRTECARTSVFIILVVSLSWVREGLYCSENSPCFKKVEKHCSKT